MSANKHASIIAMMNQLKTEWYVLQVHMDYFDESFSYLLALQYTLLHICDGTRMCLKIIKDKNVLFFKTISIFYIIFITTVEVKFFFTYPQYARMSSDSKKEACQEI